LPLRLFNSLFTIDAFVSTTISTDAIAARVGAMDVSEKRSAAEFGANVIARSDDQATTEDMDVSGVGAMDVSEKRSAAEFCANVIIIRKTKCNEFSKRFKLLTKRNNI
jgi:hypothetical protein